MLPYSRRLNKNDLTNDVRIIINDTMMSISINEDFEGPPIVETLLCDEPKLELLVNPMSQFLPEDKIEKTNQLVRRIIKFS